MDTLRLGGGSWTCEKCGRTIQGSSIHHECIDHRTIGTIMNAGPIHGSVFNTPQAGISKKGADQGAGTYHSIHANRDEWPVELLKLEAGNLITVTMVDIAKGHYNCIGEMCRRPILEHPYRDNRGWYVKIDVTINGEDFVVPVYWNTTMKRFEITLR